MFFYRFLPFFFYFIVILFYYFLEGELFFLLFFETAKIKTNKKCVADKPEDSRAFRESVIHPNSMYETEVLIAPQGAITLRKHNWQKTDCACLILYRE